MPLHLSILAQISDIHGEMSHLKIYRRIFKNVEPFFVSWPSILKNVAKSCNFCTVRQKIYISQEVFILAGNPSVNFWIMKQKIESHPKQLDKNIFGVRFCSSKTPQNFWKILKIWILDFDFSNFFAFSSFASLRNPACKVSEVCFEKYGK